MQTAEENTNKSNTSSSNKNLCGSTVLRLNALRVENALNQAGDWSVAEEASTTKVRVLNGHQIETYKLTSWPTKLIAGNTARSKIAALMLGKPLKMTDIVMKSGHYLEFCEEFIEELRSAGYIGLSFEQSDEQNQNAVPIINARFSESSKATSIFARIRNRLSLPILGAKKK